jgi:hypothetical protein
VHFAQRDVRRLVFSKEQHLVAVSNFRSSLDDNPVLGTVVVLLQAEAGTGIDLDAFDLKAPAFVDAVVTAPGAVYLAMKGVFVTFSGLRRCASHPGCGFCRLRARRRAFR